MMLGPISTAVSLFNDIAGGIRKAQISDITQKTLSRNHTAIHRLIGKWKVIPAHDYMLIGFV